MDHGVDIRIISCLKPELKVKVSLFDKAQDKSKHFHDEPFDYVCGPDTLTPTYIGNAFDYQHCRFLH